MTVPARLTAGCREVNCRVDGIALVFGRKTHWPPTAITTRMIFNMLEFVFNLQFCDSIYNGTNINKKTRTHALTTVIRDRLALERCIAVTYFASDILNLPEIAVITFNCDLTCIYIKLCINMSLDSVID